VPSASPGGLSRAAPVFPYSGDHSGKSGNRAIFLTAGKDRGAAAPISGVFDESFRAIVEFRIDGYIYPFFIENLAPPVTFSVRRSAERHLDVHGSSR
jgi:hypothetical protein